MFLTWSLVLHRSCQLLEMRWQLLYIGHMRFSVAFCTAHIDISRQYCKRSFRLGFFATEAETNLLHTLGRKTWLDHHFRDTIASSCLFYTWGIAAGKQASGGCNQCSNFAQFCTEMHVFNRGFSYAIHFWYNLACFKTAAKEKIGYYLQWLSSLIVCWIFSDKTEAIAKTFLIKYFTKLRMIVKIWCSTIDSQKMQKSNFQR